MAALNNVRITSETFANPLLSSENRSPLETDRSPLPNVEALFCKLRPRLTFHDAVAA
jgi:hypothetical protein